MNKKITVINRKEVMYKWDEDKPSRREVSNCIKRLKEKIGDIESEFIVLTFYKDDVFIIYDFYHIKFLRIKRLKRSKKHVRKITSKQNLIMAKRIQKV